MRWNLRAAEQGHRLAQFWVGRIHYKSKWVAKDFVKAHMWLEISGKTWALDDVARLMTPDQIAEARRLASEFVARKEQP
jgi:hypothetical protein